MLELLQALAPLAAGEGMCPGHLPIDVDAMPDSYRAVDLPREPLLGRAKA